MSLTLPVLDVTPYINQFTSWLSTNLPMLLSAAGGIGVVSWGFRKAKHFLFG